jgi:hypothetical protein
MSSMDFKVIYKLFKFVMNIPSSNFTMFPIQGMRKMRFRLLHPKITLEKRYSPISGSIRREDMYAISMHILCKIQSRRLHDFVF